MKEDCYLPYSKISSGELYFQNCLKSLCGYTYHLPYKLAYTITVTWPYPYNPLVPSPLPNRVYTSPRQITKNLQISMQQPVPCLLPRSHYHTNPYEKNSSSPQSLTSSGELWDMGDVDWLRCLNGKTDTTT